ncbi:TetR/AcrR family transcriptional regulator [Nocardia neocaledoniensis]|uniref:TetR/AcrR family transcriptional regulator n=1 Tax=Nocardia neocaledoniensis TaxID=236511 RepID=UPI00245597A2|nr:TetR/AcrR family transcriptional regulator [Nocardia neocaledoniensis]
MPDLPEESSSRAARILAAAGELLLARGSKGVTVADVAARAHVGKGTVYLYWRTKEDLLLGLIGRDFLALADEVTALVSVDPEIARPSRLCPSMLCIAAEHPFIAALQHSDNDLLGILAADPRSARLLEILGPDAVIRAILPIWRDSGLARTDWPLDDQVIALQALTTGFVVAYKATPRPPVQDLTRVFAAAVTSLLGSEISTPQQLRTTANGVRALIAEHRAGVLNLIDEQVSV